MALEIPTTQESFDSYLSNLESELNQESPLNDKSFLRVLAALEAGGDQGLYKYAVERAKQNLAITATEDDLDNIGAEYNVVRTPGTATVLNITVTGTNGTVISSGTSFIGDANGERYFTDAEGTISGGSVSLTVTAENAGVLGNLADSETLTMSSIIPGADASATIDSTDTTGADEETDENFRPRVLTAIRASTGGANAYDYKIWAEEVAGVKTAFPYAGRPTGTDYPGDRTIYVEADESIDPDGIAPSSLLDDVRDSLNTDPDTNLSRPPLGLIDDTLFVESISRTTFYVEIRNLQIDAAVESKAKSEISDALDLYFTGIAPFVDGVDLAQERNDTITDLTVSLTVQDVLNANGGTADGIGFGTTPSTFIDSYLLGEGELAKVGGITYV
jgi:hypothetical protein